jgi:hypothetical protein
MRILSILKVMDFCHRMKTQLPLIIIVIIIIIIIIILLVFCLVYVHKVSSFPTNSTEQSYFREAGSCSASLDSPFMGLETSFIRPHHWTLSWGQWMQFRPSPVTGSNWVCCLSLKHLFTYIVSCLEVICQDFCLFKTFSCSCIRFKGHSLREDINGSDILKKVRLAQPETVNECALYYQKKWCDNRCQITAWGWVLSPVNIAWSSRKRSPTLNEADLYDSWYSGWQCHTPGPLYFFFPLVHAIASWKVWINREMTGLASRIWFQAETNILYLPSQLL